MTYPIPDAALDDRLGFVGTAGSGKTYNAGSAVERILDRGGRVIIPDPLGVWWGLRLKPDGENASKYNVVIFGGPHGDLVLNEHAGALIGETVAKMSESCILDLSAFGTKAAERRFMLAFLTTLYRNVDGDLVHVIFDESDMWAPQRLMDKEGEAAKLLGQMETIVRRGRVKGFIPWLITQRPAVLSKDVLSQIDGLVAFKLTSSQDRDAIGSWIEGQADRQEGKRILGELPAMQRGQGVVWVPGRGILDTVAFPLKRTFDSSRTPKRGETIAKATLKPLDLDRLKAKLATVEAEAKANDPAELRREVARLKRELAGKSNAPSAAELSEAEHRGYARGKIEGYADALKLAAPFLPKLRQIAAIGTELAQGIETWSNHKPQPVPSYRPVASMRAPAPAPRQRNTAPSDVKLSKAERSILIVLAQYPEGRSKNQVAILAGYAVNGGGFANALSALRTAGRIEGSGDRLIITDEGLAALGDYEPLPTGDALLSYWLSQLSKAERSALEAIAAVYPNSLTKEEVAERAGYEPNGGGFANALSRLRSLELINRGTNIRVSDALFGE